MKAADISIRAMALLLSGCAASAMAQTAAAPAADTSGGLSEVVVTAQKRAEPLQKTPISIMAVTGADINKLGIADITDLRSVVPSLQVTPHPNSATTARVFIRGVGNNDDQITVDPSVAVYLDGIYIARGQGLTSDIAEVERIEVLRGPQGSLYGRNATGGAINYITKAPELGVFSGKQTIDYGNYNAFTTRTNLNVPIGDKLAVQLAYLHSQKDGFVRNAGTGEARFGDQLRDAYRAAVEWKPVDTIELRYSYDRSLTRDTPAYIAYVPAFYPSVIDRPTQGSPAVRNLRPNRVLVQGHSLTASWQVSDDITLKSLTGYRQLDNRTDQNYLTGAVGPFPLFITNFDQHQHQWSEELQLIGSTADHQLEYVLGGYWFDEKAHSFDTTVPAGRPSLARTATVHNTAYAVYAQATWRPTFLTGLYLTGGLRWSHDQRQATLAQTVVPAAGASIPLAPGAGDNSFSNVSPTVVLGYNVNRDVNLYLKYAKGYKAGGYNLRASTIARFEQGFGPESLDSYEAGIKSSWLNNHLRANLAVFQSNYRDIQVNVQSDPTNPAITDILNAGKARIKGAEFDLTMKPSSNLSVSLNYAYLDAKYLKIVSQTGADVTKNYFFVEAPKNTLSASAEYYFPKTSIGTFSANVQYYMQSKKYTSSNDPRYIVGDYGLLNARLTLSDIPVGFGKWELAVYAKNLTDEKYYAAYFNTGLPGAMFGEPRSYGVQLSVGF
ncbi:MULTISPECIES: TonB-dependent receptor [unclassified Sphingomonas]|uniref:TonB-dependent receptor n=1 Tax=unclassified Sphingomonas TaxID=196159 RepID=UPI000AB6BB03|nr:MULTISPECIES: TonB-dependent receptor [unclassified Sphingomonas]